MFSRRFGTVLLALTAVFAAAAQDAPITVIETEGVATVDAQPAFADFWVHSDVAEATLGAGMDATEQIETRLREAIAARSLTPNEVEMTAPAIPDVNAGVVQISGRIRFHMSNFISLETGNRLFAELCDKLREMATELGVQLEGPIFSVASAPAIVRAAAAKATENAYPVAEAIAAELKTAVFSVSSVSVVETTWNAAPEMRGTTPTIRKLTCTVRVRVAYELNQAQ